MLSLNNKSHENDEIKQVNHNKTFLYLKNLLKCFYILSLETKTSLTQSQDRNPFTPHQNF